MNAGGQSSHCVDIEDPSERLACFDAQYQDESVPEEPVPDESEPVVEADSTREPEPAQSDAQAAPPAAVAVAPVAEESAPPSSETPPFAPESQATWLGDEKVNLSSTIQAIRAGEKQKMVFLLDNEQIWMQSSPRSLPFETGDRITIKNALLGGYYMHSEKGTSTRVQRIQ